MSSRKEQTVPKVIFQVKYKRGAMPFDPHKLPVKPNVELLYAEVITAGRLSNGNQFLDVRYILQYEDAGEET